MKKIEQEGAVLTFFMIILRIGCLKWFVWVWHPVVCA